MMKPKHIETPNPETSLIANIDPSKARSEEKKPSQNKASVAYNILVALPLWKNSTGRKFAAIDGAAVPLRRSEQIKEYVSCEFVKLTGDTVSESAIEQAVLAVSGRPLETRDVHVRVGGDADRVLIDLVEGNRIAMVTAAGVTIQNNDTAFLRPTGTGPMKVADMSRFGMEDSAAAFDEFFTLIGMDDVGSRAATAGYMVQALRARGPYVMLLVRGSQGGGKTTFARELRRLLDPRSPEDVELPRNNRYLAILAEHAHLLSFDNISVILQSMSDACCRLATGSGFVTRALRTDRELASFMAARPLLFTSIGDVGVAPDLLDRALLVTLGARKEKKSEEHLSALFDELRPRLLAAVLYSMHIALKNVGSVEVPGEIRMMDSARFAVAAEAAMGLPAGSVVNAFLQARTDSALITSLDSVVTRTLEILGKTNPWRGSLEDLLDALHGSSGSSRSRAIKDLPNNARALRDRLDRVSGALRHFDVTVDLSQLHPTHRTRMVMLSRAGGESKRNGQTTRATASPS